MNELKPEDVIGRSIAGVIVSIPEGAEIVEILAVVSAQCWEGPELRYPPKACSDV